MKTLVSLIAATISANAFAIPGDKIVLSLSNVNSNNEKIESIDFYTCNIEPNIITTNCKEKIVIKQKDKPDIEKFLTSYTGHIINLTRQSFSSDFHSKIISIKNNICNVLGTAPILTTSYITYNDYSSFTIKSIDYNKTVLIDEDCARSEIIRPESDQAYYDAIKVSEILTMLARETLSAS